MSISSSNPSLLEKQIANPLKYCTILFFPALVFVAFTTPSAIWAWALPVVAFVLLPIMEQFLPQSQDNFAKDQEKQERQAVLYDFLLFLMVPIQWILIFLLLQEYQMFQLSEFRLRDIGLIFSVGICCGVFGINVAHELGHRNEKSSQWAAKSLLLSSLYMHFIIEHNQGHHRYVATKLDPATAKKGQWLYHFWLQSIVGSFRSAWSIEKKRVHNKKLTWWHNEIVHFVLLEILLVWGMTIVFGRWSALFFCISASIGILLLETINYIEHYGLERKIRENGKFERVQPHHSWNCNRYLGRIFLFELTRHSDHHAYPKRPFQILRHHEQAPEYPAGYPAMMLIALFPPLWFRVMDHRISKVSEKHHAQNN